MKRIFLSLLLLLCLYPVFGFSRFAAAANQTGSAGLEAEVKGNPPTQAPTISVPSNGQSFSSLPITVAGLCQSNTLVEIFKNDVFAGSKECAGGSYSLQIDLFSGSNVLVARDYDGLNQVSPDSNSVTVNFNNALPSTGPLISLTTQFAKRGADPGSPLTWPITLSGGTGPYAISIDWGDKTTPQLISQQFPGNITLSHTYKTAGSYEITIKATDSKGFSAFLQLVGIANGPIQQSNDKTSGKILEIIRVIPWWAIFILIGLVMLAFWLGMQHRLQLIRARLRKGQPPFG